MERNIDAYDKFSSAYLKLQYVSWSLNANRGEIIAKDQADGLAFILQEIMHDMADAVECDFIDKPEKAGEA